MRKILIATKNPGKFSEISEVLEGLDLELVFLGGLEISEEPLEDGETFEENALKKAKFFYDLLKLPTVADDSGVLVEALPGELGVKTRRWGKGEKASDEEWIEYFLERMEEEENRKAKFVSSVILFDGENEEYFLGETHGILTKSLQAPIVPGLPLSSCFIPVDCEKVYSALTTQEKNTISHRGKALHALRNFLAS